MSDDDDTATGEELVAQLMEEFKDESSEVAAVRDKLDRFATSMQEYATDNLLNNFSVEELILIHNMFGDRFVYQVWQDLDWILSKPMISDTIH